MQIKKCQELGGTGLAQSSEERPPYQAGAVPCARDAKCNSGRGYLSYAPQTAPQRAVARVRQLHAQPPILIYVKRDWMVLPIQEAWQARLRGRRVQDTLEV
jgi:hypothetical protein